MKSQVLSRNQLSRTIFLADYNFNVQSGSLKGDSLVSINVFVNNKTNKMGPHYCHLLIPIANFVIIHTTYASNPDHSLQQMPPTRLLNDVFVEIQRQPRLRSRGDLKRILQARQMYRWSNSQSKQHSMLSTPNDAVAKRNTIQYINDIALESSIAYGVWFSNPWGRRVTRSAYHRKETFQPLCRFKRNTVDLRDDPQYEYRPISYDEIRCTHPVSQFKNIMRKGVCEILDLSCIQLNGTIFLTRRSYADPNGCWESEVREVAAGCECMWPKHDKGDIAIF